ncbi:MAG: hypothetical protein Q8880_06380, partial [Bacteroidota bacterium]|nr:hypothetical protein [Bacteroidota bacterium]
DLIYSNIPLFAYDYNSQYIRLGFPWYDQMYAQMAAYGQTHFYLESDSSHDLYGRWNYPYGGTTWTYDQPTSYNRDKNETREIYSNYQLKTLDGGNVRFSYEGVNSVKNRVRNLKSLDSGQWEKRNGVYVVDGNRVNL